MSEAVSQSLTELETETNPSPVDESIAESEDVESLRAIAESEDVESLRAIAEKYQAELKYKDEEIAWCRQQIAELRELTEMLAKQPLSIHIIQEDK